MKNSKALFLVLLTLALSSCGGNQHTHTFAPEWTSDDTYHWHASTCGHDVVDGKAEHTKGTSFEYDESNHWHLCSVCEEKVEITGHNFNQTNIHDSRNMKSKATCTDPAVYYKTCICGAVSKNDSDTFTYGNPQGHTFAKEWTFDSTNHWYAATCEHKDEKGSFGPHSYDGYVLSEDGQQHYQICSCGYETEKKDHICNKWTTVKEPTVYEPGLKRGKCEVCGFDVEVSIPPIHSTVNDVNAMIAKIKALTNIVITSGSLIEECKIAYQNLIEADKKLVNDVEVLNKAVETWEKSYSLVYDPLINGMPTVEGHEVSLGEDSTFGSVAKIHVESMTETSEFGFSIPGNKYNKEDIIHIYIYSPFVTVPGVSQSAWVGNFDRDYLHTLTPESWTEIAAKGENLSPSKLNETELVEEIALQRFINLPPCEPFTGDYLLASIYAEKMSSEEGAKVYNVSPSNIIKSNTWGGDVSTITDFNDEQKGHGAKLDIKAMSGAYEIEITGIAKDKAMVFDYVYTYVYAPGSAKFYFSQLEWRNNVMNVSVSPTDQTNGAVADGMPFYAAGWNLIKIPVDYIPTTGSIFFEIYTPSLVGIWQITDFYGGYNK